MTLSPDQRGARERAPAQISKLLRELAPRVLGALVRRFRDFPACEDAVQEALLAAATQWPRDGLPDDPAAWLIRVAARRLTDVVRSEAARRRREELVVSLVAPEEQLAVMADPDEEAGGGGDETLVLLFMCCHPALSTSSAIALTLRAVGGLTTAEIARAFLVPEATMAQRISRAKQSIKDSQVAFSLPTPEARAARLGAVMHVLYLIFNEGYTASSGQALVRDDLAGEAIRLARALRLKVKDRGGSSRETALVATAGCGDVAEVTGLLALMLLTDARRAARIGPGGELVPLDEQDRSLWDRAAIVEGTALVEEALAAGRPGEYQVQAAIAALHDAARRAEDTDWPQILALYAMLERMTGTTETTGTTGNPMVSLGKIVALAMVEGPRAGLGALEALASDERLAGSHRLDAVRGHLYERAGELALAIPCYIRAAERTSSVPERNYLLTRAARLREPRH